MLRENARSGTLPMHMPGHKRNAAFLGGELPYELDITEISDFDDLHDMSGVLRALADSAAALYGAAAAFPMVNGSTGGILAAVRAAAGYMPGGSIVMSRFSHKSVYNAAELCALSPVYLMPEQDGRISPSDVETAIQSTGDIRCVIITSPSYDGVVSDIAAIAEITRAHGVPQIVDAAHGAHFGFSEHFPQNATRLGADVEIVSLHKTLPALTQSSLLLVGGGALIATSELERQLRVFETSSPSYVLLASIDRCLKLLCEDSGSLFDAHADNLRYFYDKMCDLKNLSVRNTLGNTGYDMGKVIISTNSSNITGKKLKKLLLEQHNIELEMAMPDYALAMTSICDMRASFEQLGGALLQIDAGLQCEKRSDVESYSCPSRVMTPVEARRKIGEPVLFRHAARRVAIEYVWSYPPGVPLLVPGEAVDDGVVRYVEALQAEGIDVRSDFGMLPEIICAVE